MIGAAEAADQNALSCSVSDVQTAVTDCINTGGGKVTVPAGTCTWSSTVSVSTGSGKDIRILGSGQGITVIKDFRLSIPAGGTNIIELANMTIGASSLNNAIFSEKFRPRDNPGSKELNFHHLTISGRGPIGVFEGWIGVIHHCYFTCRSGQYGWYVHGYGDYDTMRPAMGTKTSLFFENNTFDGCYHAVSGFCNSKIVFRYNTIRNSTHCVDVHGPSYNGCYYATPQWIEDGGRLFEHYNNTYENNNACGARLRSGSGISTGNKYEFTTTSMSYIGLKIDGGSASGGCINFTHSTDYPCSNAVCQGPQDFWIWNEDCHEARRGCFDASYDDCSGGIRENTEYFLRSPSNELDGFSWAAYHYPHPLVSGEANPPPNPPRNLRIISP
jgi:hypothetical protein